MPLALEGLSGHLDVGLEAPQVTLDSEALLVAKVAVHVLITNDLLDDVSALLLGFWCLLYLEEYLGEEADAASDLL